MTTTHPATRPISARITGATGGKIGGQTDGKIIGEATEIKRASRAFLPDFLILGAPKSATTTVYGWLCQHPQIFMSAPKEPVFFELEYEQGLDFYEATYFAGWDGARLRGDARTTNLYYPWIPARIKQSNPAAKLIILLRNPIERCLAHWWMEFRRQKEPLHFEEAMRANLDRICSGVRYEDADAFWRIAPSYFLPGYAATRHAALFRAQDPASAAPHRMCRTYIDAGYYAEQIERYRKLFPDEQIRIFLTEDVRLRPVEVLCDICDFLGVDTQPAKDIEYRWENMAKPMDRGLAIKWWLASRVRGQRVFYADIRRRPAIRPEFRQFLADHFHKFNVDLSKLLKRDLKDWS